MNIKSDYKVCEHCHNIFNQLLENLADSVSEIMIKQSTITQKFGKKSEEFVRGSSEDPKYNNKLLNKFFRRISTDLEYKRYSQVKDYLDIMSSDEKDTLESKFKKMRRILDNGNMASSYGFDETPKERGLDRENENIQDDHHSTIQNLIMNLEDDSGILNDEFNDQLTHFESSKLMELANNKYNLNFKESNEFKSSKYIDNDRNNVQTATVDRKTEERPLTANRKNSNTKPPTGSKLLNTPNFKREAKPRISKLN